MYQDRVDAGRQLARALRDVPLSDPIVLGLPRGGVPVANEVARALSAPLDVWVVRKIGAPGHEELGIGAVAEGGEVVLEPELLDAVGADDEMVAPVVTAKRAEVESRAQRFREGRPAPRVSNRTVIVVDDGVANGVTARAALRSLRRAGAGRVILAVPVGSREGLAACVPYADEVVCPYVPTSLRSVGAHYQDFGQTSDDEVLRLLAAARQRQRSHVAERSAPR
ncbi:MAG: phosphoribosyltransferase [Deltaproteobacteria bacterium]|nr:phosphoribosyltransferase [Deltaproteobacteria bacterium]